MRQLKDATDDIKREIQNSTDIDTDFTKDIRKEIDDVKKNVNEVSGSIKRDLNK
jgi:sec-independent protein translocase protein TatA